MPDPAARRRERAARETRDTLPRREGVRATRGAGLGRQSRIARGRSAPLPLQVDPETPEAADLYEGRRSSPVRIEIVSVRRGRAGPLPASSISSPESGALGAARWRRPPARRRRKALPRRAEGFAPLPLDELPEPPIQAHGAASLRARGPFVFSCRDELVDASTSVHEPILRNGDVECQGLSRVTRPGPSSRLPVGVRDFVLDDPLLEQPAVRRRLPVDGLEERPESRKVSFLSCKTHAGEYGGEWYADRVPEVPKRDGFRRCPLPGPRARSRSAGRDGFARERDREHDEVRHGVTRAKTPHPPRTTIAAMIAR